MAIGVVGLYMSLNRYTDSQELTNYRHLGLAVTTYSGVSALCFGTVIMVMKSLADHQGINWFSSLTMISLWSGITNAVILGAIIGLQYFYRWVPAGSP